MINSTLAPDYEPFLDAPDSTQGSVSAAAAALCAVLTELAGVVESLSNERYVARRGGDSAIGSHVRHCLDHATALINGLTAGVVDYDARRRGTSVEFSRVAATRLLDELVREFGKIADEALSRPLSVQSMVTATGPPVLMRSTVGRELVFLLSHTIHHNAMIATMARAMGGSVPQRFGFAPATVAFLRGDDQCMAQTG